MIRFKWFEVSALSFMFVCAQAITAQTDPGIGAPGPFQFGAELLVEGTDGGASFSYQVPPNRHLSIEGLSALIDVPQGSPDDLQITVTFNGIPVAHSVSLLPQHLNRYMVERVVCIEADRGSVVTIRARGTDSSATGTVHLALSGQLAGGPGTRFRAEHGEPVEIPGDIVVSGIDNGTNFVYTVPANRSLSIESVTAAIDVPSGAAVALGIKTTVNGLTATHQVSMLPALANSFSVDTSVRIFADAGTQVTIGVMGTDPMAFGTIHVVLRGRLLPPTDGVDRGSVQVHGNLTFIDSDSGTVSYHVPPDRHLSIDGVSALIDVPGGTAVSFAISTIVDGTPAVHYLSLLPQELNLYAVHKTLCLYADPGTQVTIGFVGHQLSGTSVIDVVISGQLSSAPPTACSQCSL